MALVAAVDHPAVRMMLDLYHAGVGGGFAEPGSAKRAAGRLRRTADRAAPGSADAHGRTTDLIELVRRAGPLIGEIQVADVPGRCEPGTGEIDYPAIAAALSDSGYRGTVGLEAWASGDSAVALERFRNAFTV
jgi:hydroxypyruvate isomerase